MRRLTARQVMTAKPEDGRRVAMLADGGNLYLQATIGKNDTVRRSWVFHFELGRGAREGARAAATAS